MRNMPQFGVHHHSTLFRVCIGIHTLSLAPRSLTPLVIVLSDWPFKYLCLLPLAGNIHYRMVCRTRPLQLRVQFQ